MTANVPQLMCNYFNSLVVAINSTLYTGSTNHSFGDSGLCDYNCGSGGNLLPLNIPVLVCPLTFFRYPVDQAYVSSCGYFYVLSLNNAATHVVISEVDSYTGSILRTSADITAINSAVPSLIAYNPTTDNFYVVNVHSGIYYITVISRTDFSCVSGPVGIAGYVSSIAYSAASDRVVVGGAGGISILHPQTLAVLYTASTVGAGHLLIGTDWTSISISETLGLLYCAQRVSDPDTSMHNRVSAINFTGGLVYQVDADTPAMSGGFDAPCILYVPEQSSVYVGTSNIIHKLSPTLSHVADCTITIASFTTYYMAYNMITQNIHCMYPSGTHNTVALVSALSCAFTGQYDSCDLHNKHPIYLPNAKQISILHDSYAGDLSFSTY